MICTRLIVAMVVTALSICACEKKTEPIALQRVDASIPMLGKETPAVRPGVSTASVEEIVHYPNGRNELAQEYIKWFNENGWQSMSKSEDVNALSYVFRKDKTQVTVSSGADGVRLRVSQPRPGTP